MPDAPADQPREEGESVYYCAHGMTKEQRKRDGCDACDEEQIAASMVRAVEKEHRLRVVETARALLIETKCESERPSYSADARWAVNVATEIEEVFARYLATGSTEFPKAEGAGKEGTR